MPTDGTPSRRAASENQYASSLIINLYQPRPEMAPESILQAEEAVADRRIVDRRKREINQNVKQADAASPPTSPMLLKVQDSVERSLQFIR